MSKYIFLLLFCPLVVFAQSAPKVGIGLSYMSLDLPDDMVFRPSVSVEKHLIGRLSVGAQLGGIRYQGADNTHNIPEIRRRFTSDLTAKISALRYKRTALKIGVGPSLWYRNDEVVSRVQLRTDAPDFVSKPVSWDMKTNKGWHLGYNASVEVETAVSRNFSLAAGISVANLGRSGLSSILGLHGYYQLPK